MSPVQRVTMYIGHTTQSGDTLAATAVSNKVAHALEAVGIDGFTAVQGIGYWKGVREVCTVVTVFVQCVSPELREVPKRLAQWLDQEAVLFEVCQSQIEFVGAE